MLTFINNFKGCLLLRCWAVSTVWLAMWLASPWTCADDTYREWRFYSADCHLVPRTWNVQSERTTQRVAGGNPSDRCHRVDFNCQHGTQVLVGCEIDSAFVIRELEIAVDVCSEKPQVQLLIEVTFPKTSSPTGRGPMTTLISAPVVNVPQEWVTLRMGGLEEPLTEKLKERLWVLRRKHQTPIDDSGAFVSRVIINAYSGPGPHRIWLKQPMVSGIVAGIDSVNPIMRDLNLALVSFDDDDQRPPARSQRQGTVLEVDRSPFFPRIVQHNGESFEFLHDLGFNTIQLAATATFEQLNEARRLNMWLICPPPPSTGVKPIGDFFDPVLAWSLGEDLSSSQLLAAQRLAQEIRIADSKRNRPLYAHASSGYSRIAETVDMLAVGRSPIGTNFPLDQYSDWLQRVGKTIGGQLPVCADVQTECLPHVIQQVGFVTGGISPTPLDREQIRGLVYEAIAGSARGLRFLSRTRLDSNDPQTRLRAQTLRWINYEVSLIEPWAVGGVVMGEENVGQEAVVTTLKTNRGQLLLIQQKTGWEQYVSGDAPMRKLRIPDSFSAIGDQAYLLESTGLTPLATERFTGGGAIQIDQCPPLAAVILTQNPTVLNRITQVLESFGPNAMINRRAELTRQWAAFTQVAESELNQMGRSSPTARGAINEALNALQQAEGLLLSSSFQTALPFLDQADQRLAVVRRELIGIAREQFTSETSAPLLSHVSLLPRHWELVGRMSPIDLAPNAMPGGDFEDLNHMLRNGWERMTNHDQRIDTQLEISPLAAGAGESGLLMKVSGDLATNQTFDAPPLTVRSAYVPVRNGQMILIHGWIKIDSPLQATEDGVIIYESLAGKALALNFRRTESWQEFKLYRAAGENNQLRVTIEMNGLGTAMLDELTVRTVDLPTAAALPPGRGADNRQPQTPR